MAGEVGRSAGPLASVLNTPSSTALSSVFDAIKPVPICIIAAGVGWLIVLPPCCRCGAIFRVRLLPPARRPQPTLSASKIPAIFLIPRRSRPSAFKWIAQKSGEPWFICRAIGRRNPRTNYFCAIPFIGVYWLLFATQFARWLQLGSCGPVPALPAREGRQRPVGRGRAE